MRKLLLLAMGTTGLLTVLLTVVASAQENYPPGTQPTVSTAAVQVAGEQVTRRSNAAGRLAFTGSQHATSLIVIGVVAVALGLVLLVCIRRRPTGRVDAVR